MVLLRAHLAVVLAALLVAGCKFDPAVTGLGYQPCDTTDECKAGGLVCLKGLCVPDCGGAYTVARLEPESADDTGDYFKMMCPGGECGVNEVPYLDVRLPPSTFLELGSTKSEDDVEPCYRVVIRFSILAPPEPQGRELSVVIRGKNATGVVPENQGGIIKLVKFIEEEDLDQQFREHTYFYVVDTGIFAWPVRLRLVPVANNTVAFFWIRGFEMSCCE